jgi:hypothetical protein
VTSLDLAGLVLVASRTLGLEEQAVLALADLDAAAEVLAQVRQTPGGPERQAATLVHGLVRRRVFGPRSGEVGVLAALQLLALQGREAVDLGPPAQVRELLAGIADGRVGTDELAAWLERSTTGWRMEMFERFTDRARNVVRAAQVLATHGVDLAAARQEVVRLLALGPAGRAGTRPSREALVADIDALYEEIVRLAREVHRLTELLREHGIEPDEGTSRSA